MFFPIIIVGLESNKIKNKNQICYTAYCQKQNNYSYRAATNKLTHGHGYGASFYVLSLFFGNGHVFFDWLLTFLSVNCGKEFKKSHGFLWARQDVRGEDRVVLISDRWECQKYMRRR
jgi:hypothetical protein